MAKEYPLTPMDATEQRFVVNCAEWAQLLEDWLNEPAWDRMTELRRRYADDTDETRHEVRAALYKMFGQRAEEWLDNMDEYREALAALTNPARRQELEDYGPVMNELTKEVHEKLSK